MPELSRYNTVILGNQVAQAALVLGNLGDWTPEHTVRKRYSYALPSVSHAGRGAGPHAIHQRESEQVFNEERDAKADEVMGEEHEDDVEDLEEAEADESAAEDASDVGQASCDKKASCVYLATQGSTRSSPSPSASSHLRHSPLPISNARRRSRGTPFIIFRSIAKSQASQRHVTVHYRPYPRIARPQRPMEVDSDNEDDSAVERSSLSTPLPRTTSLKELSPAPSSHQDHRSSTPTRSTPRCSSSSTSSRPRLEDFTLTEHGLTFSSLAELCAITDWEDLRLSKEHRGGSGRTVWVMTHGPFSVVGPPLSLDGETDDIYIHHDDRASRPRMWVLNRDKAWVSVRAGDCPPSDSSRRLSVLKTGEPSWVTRGSYSVYRSRKKRACRNANGKAVVKM
ncbi:hypothetical protein L227DRAFT_614024 [Lentinus tigrinus ALCF2SS1-6]|uniref:Uncharacterized protein n=1 Tax=Lentinus tigrinus ALCF2SS1-6 TaxID=1328759 RepID=A0A5C2S2S7_9APHY|nr:hypothetical protein L227DRAFT_614024 [Lentinus tigrinus ALCF2SS1-6]